MAAEMYHETGQGAEKSLKNPIHLESFSHNQSPLSRVAKPEEVAEAVVFLASKGTDFMTGCILDVNGASNLRT